MDSIKRLQERVAEAEKQNDLLRGEVEGSVAMAKIAQARVAVLEDGIRTVRDRFETSIPPDLCTPKLEDVFALVPGQSGEGSRCERCGWRLADSPSKGCVPGNCSQRPLPAKRGEVKS